MPQSQGGSLKKKRKTKSVAWYKKKYSAIELATKAFNGVKMIKDFLNVELKTVDVALTSNNVLNTGAVVHLTPVSQGDTRVQRNGKSIFGNSLFLRGSLGAGASSNVLRIIIFCDTMNTGTTPTAADVLETTGSALAPYSALDQTTSQGRYKILSSKIYSLSNVTNQSQVFKMYIPFKKHVKYTGPNATDEWKNQCYMLAISTQSTANGPNLDGICRFSFYDN